MLPRVLVDLHCLASMDSDVYYLTIWMGRCNHGSRWSKELYADLDLRLTGQQMLFTSYCTCVLYIEDHGGGTHITSTAQLTMLTKVCH
jgi:hypothetical protein